MGGEWSAVQGVEFDPENMALMRPKAETFNLLDAFYAQPERFAYTFQNYVFVTRMLQNQRSAENWQNPIRLLERSVFRIGWCSSAPCTRRSGCPSLSLPS